MEAMVALSKAFALAAATEEAARVREKAGFFQIVRVAHNKAGGGHARRSREIDLAVEQIVSKTVISTKIVDVFKAAGLRSPDISISVRRVPDRDQGNQTEGSGAETLKSRLNNEIPAQMCTNVVQAKSFTQRLEEGVAKYHNGAIRAAQLLEELIALAHDLKAIQSRGEDPGLSPEEFAFYDALSMNKSTREIMGDDKRRLIATELVTTVKKNVSVD